MNTKNTFYMSQNGTDRGRLRINVTTGNLNPVSNATVSISYSGDPESTVEQTNTDNSGQTDSVELNAPPVEYSLEPSIVQPYAEYTVTVTAQGFLPVDVSGTEILSGETSILNVRLQPEVPNEIGNNIVIPAHTLYGNYPPKIAEAEIKPVNEPGEIVLSRVVVPEYIVVHDGAPTDTTARDYYVTYRDYITNVASSEIYSTWPESTIRANVLAIMSFTLNRVYTEWYRNKGYDFTITSSTAFDHKWIYGRNTFDNISLIVDELFADYLSRPNVKQPILTQYCDGQRTSCPNWMPQYAKRPVPAMETSLSYFIIML